MNVFASTIYTHIFAELKWLAQAAQHELNILELDCDQQYVDS